MGDACEMLVAAELTLAGIPALKVPDLWPGYDVIAQPLDRPPQQISVKSRTFRRGDSFLEYQANDQFDWLAIVLLPGADEAQHQFFIVPRKFADSNARRNSPTTKSANGRYWRIDEIPRIFARFKDNFRLDGDGVVFMGNDMVELIPT